LGVNTAEHNYEIQTHPQIKNMKPIPDNETPKQFSPEINATARAVRFAIAVILFGLSYVSIRASFGFGGFEDVLTGMGMTNKTLPALTTFIFAVRPELIFVSIAVPLAALACFWDQNVTRSIYNLGRLTLLTIVQLILLYDGLCGPLVKLIANVSSAN
jgi:hypothetical protein